MVIEKLIDEVGETYVPMSAFYGNSYRVLEMLPYRYQKVYWYDGVKFLFGEREGSVGLSMVEVSTGAVAVHSSEIKGKITCEKLIKRFHEKLQETKKTRGLDIHQVTALYRSKNLDLEAWQIKLLTV